MIESKNTLQCVIVVIVAIGILASANPLEGETVQEDIVIYKLQFRIRPTRTLLDLEPKRFETIMTAIEDIDDYRIYDDVVSDATFITVVVSWKEPPSTEALNMLRATLLRVERVRILVVDKGGNETDLADLDAEGQMSFVTAWQ